MARPQTVIEKRRVTAIWVLLVALLFTHGIQLTAGETETETAAQEAPMSWYDKVCSQVAAGWEALLQALLLHKPDGYYQRITFTYCTQPLDTLKIFQLIREQVLNQNSSLDRLQVVLGTDKNFRSVVLAGPPIAGKTMTSLALRQYFPWPENVQSYSWATSVFNFERRYQDLYWMADRLNACGINLLIIDDLKLEDHELVSHYNQILLQRMGTNRIVLVVYIFSLESCDYWTQYEELQRCLPHGTPIINFRHGGLKELKDCVKKKELGGAKLKLCPNTMRRIFDEALYRVQHTGSKFLDSYWNKHIRPLAQKIESVFR